MITLKEINLKNKKTSIGIYFNNVLKIVVNALPAKINNTYQIIFDFLTDSHVITINSKIVDKEEDFKTILHTMIMDINVNKLFSEENKEYFIHLLKEVRSDKKIGLLKFSEIFIEKRILLISDKINDNSSFHLEIKKQEKEFLVCLTYKELKIFRTETYSYEYLFNQNEYLYELTKKIIEKDIFEYEEFISLILDKYNKENHLFNNKEIKNYLKNNQSKGVLK